MKELKAKLGLALRHVTEANSIVERQRERIAEAKAAGARTWEAEEMLDVFMRTLARQEDHAQILRKELDASKGGLSGSEE